MMRLDAYESLDQRILLGALHVQSNLAGRRIVIKVTQRIAFKRRNNVAAVLDVIVNPGTCSAPKSNLSRRTRRIEVKLDAKAWGGRVKVLCQLEHNRH